MSRQYPKCPYCGRTGGHKKHSKSRLGKQVYICRNPACRGAKKKANKTGKVYFTEQKYKKITNQEKDYLTAIVALTEMKISKENLTLLDEMKNVYYSREHLKKLEFEVKEMESSKIDDSSIQAVICRDGDKITVFKK